MSSIHPLLITLLQLLILVLCPAKSESIDPYYKACAPFECGHLNISYPFYVLPTQPSYCGLEGFNVSCNNRSQTVIKISGDDYIINQIFYDKLTIHITNSAFSKSVFGCPSSIHSFPLGGVDGRFNFISPHSDIYLFQDSNCSRKIEAKSKNYTQIKCNDDDNDPNPLLLAVYGEDFNAGEFGECGKRVIVPYYKDEVAESGGIEGILRGGIVLDYNANNCSHCSDSNGRCGFNGTTREFMCFCPNEPRRAVCHLVKTSTKRKVILPSVLLGTLLIILVLLIVYWQQRKRRSRQSTFRSIMMSFKRARSGIDGGSMRGVTLFSYNELEEATRTFDPKRVLGEGGFGIVYYGKLKDGREVAVKRLFEKNYKRIEQFKNEIKILTDLRHENLVALYGCTSRNSRELLLVYEYIPNGTVADHLHSEDIIHRDVKTNNILLDSNFGVKVADFGLSRLFPADLTHISTAPQGTPGYLDPEYHQCYHLTDKSDVYSFGVVLVELISSLPWI